MTMRSAPASNMVWVMLLVVVSIAMTLGFACVAPFAGFAAFAALTLPRREGLLAVLGIWLANQMAGFLFLHYPLTIECCAWGVALGLAIALSLAAARFAGARLASSGAAAAGIAAFAAAFAAHQLFLLLTAAAVLGGLEDFAMRVELQALAINGGCFVGLLAVRWIADRTGPGEVRQHRLALRA